MTHGDHQLVGAAIRMEDGDLDVERLAKAMWDALSHEGVLRIHADGWKELNDIATDVARAYDDASPSPGDNPHRQSTLDT